jgi:hypothetical protein
MKRMLAPLLLALSLIVPLAASANHSPGDGPDLDKVDGTVEDVFPSTLHVNAISNPDGTDARGKIWYRADVSTFFPAFDEAGEVTCLRVVGNRAAVGVRIDRSKLPTFPGEGNGFLFHVVDMGEPGDMDTHLDIPLTTPPTVCPVPISFPFPHKSGNFIVHDAP